MCATTDPISSQQRETMFKGLEAWLREHRQRHVEYVLQPPPRMTAAPFVVPMDDSSYMGLFWGEHHAERFWILNCPEALHGLVEGQKRGCSQPSLLWEWDGDTVRGRIDPNKPDDQADLKLEMTMRPYGLDILLQVTNVQEAAYLDFGHFDVCLQNSTAWRFGDPKGERTLVRKGGKWISLYELFGDEAVTLSRQMALGQGKGQPDEGIIVRQGEDPETLIAMAWDDVYKVASNLNAITCIHSDPKLGPLAPGQTISRRGRLWIGRWSLNGLYDCYRKAFS